MTRARASRMSGSMRLVHRLSSDDEAGAAGRDAHAMRGETAPTEAEADLADVRQRCRKSGGVSLRCRAVHGNPLIEGQRNGDDMIAQSERLLLRHREPAIERIGR